MPSRVYRLYGVQVRTDVPLPCLEVAEPAAVDLTFHLAPELPLPDDWDAVEPFRRSYWLTENRESYLDVYRVARGVVARYPSRADLLIEPERIIARPTDEAHRPLARLVFLASAMALWLEMHGLIAVHASSVVVEGRAVAFVAHSGSGKSSLAASLLAAGYPLLCDDILPIECREGCVMGRSGYNHMRLWPEQARYWLGEADALPRVHPELEKRWVRLHRDGPWSLHEEPCPLAVCYLPWRREPTTYGEEIAIEPISSRDALLELLRYSFVGEFADVVAEPARRFDLLARTAESVRFRRLTYPTGLEFLPRVRDAVLADVSAA